MEGLRDMIRLVYLDHNVLDALLKGRVPCVRALLLDPSYTPIFSSENLNEIQRSKGCEHAFLELLKEIEARYLSPHLTRDFCYTGEASIESVDPFGAFEMYKANKIETPEMGYGLTGMLQKLYGGLQDQGYDEVFSLGADELSKLLDSALEGLGDEPIPGIDRATLAHQVEQVKAYYRGLTQELAATIENAHPNSGSLRQIEASLGGGPLQLKNIRGPGVLDKIWDRIRPSIPPNTMSMEQFFGVEPIPGVTPPKWQHSPVEKVNAIYHQLNFLGYYRDKTMKKPRRFGTHLSDMTHAGLAAFCELFICMDEDLVRKTEAAYEYLGVRTAIVHIKIRPNNALQSDCLQR